jgi:hypothetical protein
MAPMGKGMDLRLELDLGYNSSIIIRNSTTGCFLPRWRIFGLGIRQALNFFVDGG